MIEHKDTNDECLRWVANLNKQVGDKSKWPPIGCGSKFVPWKRGPSMVAELLMDDGKWASFLCERPPNKLLDAIFEKRLAFYEAAGRLQPEHFFQMIPITFPMTNVLDKDLYPGVGYFDVDAAMAMQRPYFSGLSWVTLCRKIAAEDMGNLESIFDLCTKMGVNN